MSCDPYCFVFIALVLPLSLVEYCPCNLCWCVLVFVNAKSVHAMPSQVKSSQIKSSQVFVYCLVTFGVKYSCTWVLTTLASSGLITEYSTATMNPAVSRFLCLHQGDRAIEDYVEDFCGQCHLVAFNDVALKDIFRVGLSDPIHSRLLGRKIYWSLEQCIDHAQTGKV